MKAKMTVVEVSHLKRREFQAPIVSKLINGFAEHLGEERTKEIISKVIQKDAIDSGRQLAEELCGNGMSELAKVVREIWCDEEAMIIDVITENSDEFHFNVNKCRYAEVYEKLGIPDLGRCLSCDRDFPFNEGFNPEITLERTQTIMEGASHCDFRYFRGPRINSRE